jgi:hypothetical protein
VGTGFRNNKKARFDTGLFIWLPQEFIDQFSELNTHLAANKYPTRTAFNHIVQISIQSKKST